MLDSEQMNRLTIDACAKRPPSIPGAEAQAFYDKVKVEVEEMKAKGIMPDFLPD
jgi:hypothetical protein